MLGTTDITVTERQYFKQKPTVEEVQAIARLLPGGAKDILSTRSRRYKELGLAERGDLSEAELVALLAEEPGLWRRPIVIEGDQAVVGFDQKRLESLLS